jgi:hypothetical protein
VTLDSNGAAFEAGARDSMGDIGRNEPCSCGSGKKYKKCCLLKEAPAATSARQRLHDADGRLLRDVMRWAVGAFGEEFEAAYDEYAQDPEKDSVHYQLFVPWSCCHFRVRGRPVIDWYLEARARNLPLSDRAWLESQQRAWLSVWEVTAVQPGEGMHVTDLLTGEKRAVQEVSGSKMLVVRDALLARVVDHDGSSVFAGCHPRTLPPQEADDVVRWVRMFARGRGKFMKMEKVRAAETEKMLLDVWNKVVDAMDRRPLPVLHNTDGEPILMTTDHYTPSSTKALAAIEERLAREPGVIPPDPDERGPERDYAFTRAGNKMHKSWDNTIVGRAIVDPRGVRLETNSRARADALRGRFEALCDGLATHRAREHVDPMSKVRKGRAGERLEEKSPEAAAAVRAFKVEQYQTWLDEELPALDGKTPREAVKTPARRRQVEVILKEIEHREVREPEGVRFDVGKLRKELGLRS